uniref:Uncharacterized protein n=1 Tax=Salmonella bongori TaxID=54736 RepID=F2Q8F9_SALBN|nr:hypothetical protein Sb1_0095 [Salmonella bongori]
MGAKHNQIQCAAGNKGNVTRFKRRVEAVYLLHIVANQMHTPRPDGMLMLRPVGHRKCIAYNRMIVSDNGGYTTTKKFQLNNRTVDGQTGADINIHFFVSYSGYSGLIAFDWCAKIDAR